VRRDRRRGERDRHRRRRQHRHDDHDCERQRGEFARGAGVRALERRTVQANVVVATKTGFATVTIERGFVQSVSGQRLTIREGTKKATYKTVMLTIPSNAKVRDNRQASTLSALTAGQRVAVVQAPQRTGVIARSAPTP
jgi:hypothetical protein